MEIRVEHLGGVQFEIKARQHVIFSDQPAEDGGFDEGLTPPEMLLASLGSCAGFYAAQYLQKHKRATEGTIVRVTADKAREPARLDNFRLALEIPGDLNQQDLDGVRLAVQHCLIHNTLLNSPKISISVGAAELSAK
ncbi:MAG TPA: OsmC family protein [Candidatus Acidoferrum sp.]|jgi:uncharacterized OsmC-like protein|nr:OsmC family protein [Candidatus Acidoferrum sp.]